MADNVPITPGAGTSIATDDIGGVQYQRIKVNFGVDGSATDVSAASPLPVTVGNASLAVTGTFWQGTQPISGNVGVTGSVAVTGTFWQATQPVSGTVTANAGTGTMAVSLAALPALAAGAAIIGALTANQSVNQTQVNGVAMLTGNGVTGTGSMRVTIASDNSAFSVNAVQSGTWNIGTITTLPALAAGAALIGKVGIDQTTPGTTNAVVSTPATPTPFGLNSAATTNATSVKNAAGTLYTIACSNAGAAAAFVKLYNKASAPTVGTDVPVLTIPIAASSVQSLNLGETGHRFATGIALAITNLVADSDTTAVAANQVKAILDYI